MDATVARLQEMVAGFFPDALGLRFVSAVPERVVAELQVRDDLCTVPGILHGGAIMAFADTLGAAGTSLNLRNGAGTTTIESKTNFFAPGIAGTKVTGECVALHRGRRTMVWQTSVRGEDGKLLALVTQTQAVLEPNMAPRQQLSALFDGLDAAKTKALLAELERGGAAIYRRLAENETDPAARAALLEGAAREEANAQLLEGKE